jgi:hypothetical protein
MDNRILTAFKGEYSVSYQEGFLFESSTVFHLDSGV